MLISTVQQSDSVIHIYIHSFSYSFLFFICILNFYFIYLFLSVLGLVCCMRTFSSCCERGLLFIVMRGLLIAVASLVAEHGRASLAVACGLSSCGSRA